MDEHAGQTPHSPTKAELRARVIGNALDHDAEDVLFWRNASETLRGQTLHRLRARGRAMRAAVPHAIEEQADKTRLVITRNGFRIITLDE